MLLSFLAVAALCSPQKLQCGSSTTYCPASMACCKSQYSPSTFGCEVEIGNLSKVSAGCGDGLPAGRTLCCKMGPGKEPSTTLKNVLVIGDSVSIGYVGGVTAQLAPKALVQHGPWDVSDGGAGDAATGVACLDRFLVTQAQTAVKWDLITFNFGLHDMTNTSHCEQLYRDQLTTIFARLSALQTKLIWITTTPFMPHRLQNDTVVEDMNAIAKKVVGPTTPVVDLYSAVTAKCGKEYTDCSICRKTPCSYHYNSEGMEMQAKIVADAISKQLAL